MGDLRCLCGEEVAAYHVECLSLVTPCRRCGSVTPGLQDCYCARSFGEPSAQPKARPMHGDVDGD